MARENEQFSKQRANEYMDKFARSEARANNLCKTVVDHGIDMHVAPEMPDEVTVIINGQKYKVI